MNITNSTDYTVEIMPLQGTGGKTLQTVIVKATFDFSSGNPELSGAQYPILYGDEMYEDTDHSITRFESDLVPYKPATDVIVVGKAHAPSGKPVHSFNAGITIGNVKKYVKVFGDRIWEQEKKIKTLFRPSMPEPVMEVELRYDLAFGGSAQDNMSYCAENLLGKGFLSDTSTPEEIIKTSLPNIEDPDQLIQKPLDHPEPVGIGFYPRTCQPRLGLMGTYDETWRKTISPGLPEDFDDRYFNAAHTDLQITPYLKGDETVTLLNLTTDGELSFSLPGISPVCTLEKKGDELKLLPLNLDTICFITEEKKAYMIWRGASEVSESFLTGNYEICVS